MASLGWKGLNQAIMSLGATETLTRVGKLRRTELVRGI
jgi:hypothetical protein